MSTSQVLSPTEFQSRLERYLYERSEEGRAVRVGEKEVSEQAAIVRRYADLFSREQLDALQDAEEASSGDERELLFRLRKTCEGGLIANELTEAEDDLENRLLADARDVRRRRAAAANRAGQAGRAVVVCRPRGARTDPGGSERVLQSRPALAARAWRFARRRPFGHRRRRRAKRGREGDLAPRSVRGARAGEHRTRRPLCGSA